MIILEPARKDVRPLAFDLTSEINVYPTKKICIVVNQD
jgi:hypothetical protein